MASVFAKQVPDHLVEILDNWRKRQIPSLNRQQAITHVLYEWVERHKKEFIKDGIIVDEQMGLFNGRL